MQCDNNGEQNQHEFKYLDRMHWLAPKITGSLLHTASLDSFEADFDRQNANGAA